MVITATETQAVAKPFEATTTAKLSKSLRTIDITAALLPLNELETCYSLHYRIRILNKVLFSGKEAVYRAILNIAEPSHISNGDVKAEKVSYFNWSQAKRLIAKKFGFTDFSYSGTKNKLTGLIMASACIGDDTEHRRKVARISKQVTTKYPNVLFTWPRCTKTIEADNCFPEFP